MNIRIIIATCLPCLFSALVLAQPPSPQSDLKAKVQKLAEQMLRGPDFADRDAAEWELLKLGPDIVQHLPDSKTAASRVTAVRAILADLKPRTATLKFTDGKLSDVLDSLKKQTGMSVEDRRQNKDPNTVTIDVKDATFWQIAEVVAAKTNSRLHLYQADGKVALIDGAPRPPDSKLFGSSGGKATEVDTPSSTIPTHLQGAFRIAVKRIAAKLDFESQTHVTDLGLEIAWEPRFSPYLIEIGKLSFIAPAVRKVDSPMMSEVPGRGPVVVTENNAKEFDVFLPSPSRKVESIIRVQGQFVVTMPSKSLEFTFKKPDKHVADGVQVKLEELSAKGAKWKVQLSVEVPAAGPSFASFQTWLGSKAWLDQCGCQLERIADGVKDILRPDPLYTQVGEPAGNKVMVSYQFTPPKNAGQIGDWRLVYRVPGRMVEVTVPFVFDRVELP